MQLSLTVNPPADGRDKGLRAITEAEDVDEHQVPKGTDAEGYQTHSMPRGIHAERHR